MRNAFAAELTVRATEDNRIVLLSGDIGNRLFDSFKEQCPGRFFNCGVAEANMTGVAAGMALCGLKPLTYTIAPFNTARCLEQIKVDVCYQDVPVIIVGVGAGLAYAGLGATHHALEDVAILRAFPNMTIICPGDSVEVRLALRAALRHPGPVYLRLGKKNEPVVHEREPLFEIGKGIVLSRGTDACLLSTGNMLPLVMEVASLLEDRGVSTQVVSMHTVKPLDTDLVAEAFASFRVVVAIEEHSRIGGFGSSVAEWLAEQPPQPARLCCIGTDDMFVYGAGNQGHARSTQGLTSNDIVNKIFYVLQAVLPVHEYSMRAVSVS